MEEQNVLALIDQYLLGTIRPEDKATLEKLMATDPSIATMVRESNEAFKVLKHARNRQLKEKLRELDKDDLHRQGFFNRRIGLLAFCMICILPGSYLTYLYFSPSAVAKRNFITYTAPSPSALGDDEIVKLWKDAENAFLQRDYEKAIQLYLELSDQATQTDLYTARWNMLLAQLALDGATPGWQMALDAYAREVPEPFASLANKLNRMLDSGFRKVFIMRLREDISVLKPRLI